MNHCLYYVVTYLAGAVSGLVTAFLVCAYLLGEIQNVRVLVKNER